MIGWISQFWKYHFIEYNVCTHNCEKRECWGEILSFKELKHLNYISITLKPFFVLPPEKLTKKKNKQKKQHQIEKAISLCKSVAQL